MTKPPQAVDLRPLREPKLDRLDWTKSGELEQYIATDSRHHLKDRYYRATLKNGQDIAIGVTDDEEWLDVIMREKRPGDGRRGPFTGPYQVFGFRPRPVTVIPARFLDAADEVRGILAREFGIIKRRWSQRPAEG